VADKKPIAEKIGTKLNSARFVPCGSVDGVHPSGTRKATA
jgi:hypothetical protein